MCHIPQAANFVVSAIAVAGGLVVLPSRSIGLFTGSCSSVQVGRIHLIDAALALGDRWSANGWSFECKYTKQRSIGLSIFVDNIHVFSRRMIGT